MIRFCMRCGAPLESGKRFCTNCGSPAGSASDNGRNVDGRKRGRENRFRCGLVLGIASLAVALLVIGVGAFIMVNGGIDEAIARIFSPSDDGRVAESAEYGSLTSVKVASSTRVLPQDLEGSSASYRVRIKQADTPSGDFIAVDDLPILSVTEPDGFSLADFGSLEEGTYYLSVKSETGAVFDLPPLLLTGDSSAEELSREIEIVRPSNMTSEPMMVRRGKYGAFLGVLTDLSNTYAEPSLTVMRLNDNQCLAWVAGVSYAELVDFGDGAERLVVMYCLDDKFAESDVVEVGEDDSVQDFGPEAADYRIEVYEYDPIADEAVMVCQTTPEKTREGRAVLRYVKDSDGHMLIAAGGTSEEGNVRYGINESGLFGALSGSGGEIQANGYCFFNTAQTQEEALENAGIEGTSCEKTAQSVKDIVARLEALMSW